MINFNSKKLKQVKLFLRLKKSDSVFYFFIILGILGIFIYLLLFFNIVNFSTELFLALSFILIITGLISTVVKFFMEFGLKDIKPDKPLSKALESQENLIDYLDFYSLEAFSLAIDFAQEKKLSVFSALLVIIGLALTKRGHFILSRLGFDFKKFNDYFLDDISLIKNGSLQYFDKSLEETVLVAAKKAVKEDRNQIEIGDLFFSASQLDYFSQKVIFDLNLKKDDLENVIDWEDRIHRAVNYEKAFWKRNVTERTGGIGADWAAGWTPYLLMFSRPIGARNIFSTYFNSPHKQEIDETERVLSRTGKNNVLLVGPPGVGKKSIVYGLADKVIRGQSLATLKNKHFYVLDVNRIIANSGQGDIENRLSLVLNDAVHAGNVVLFIDNFNALISGGENKFGSIDASSILIPYLQSSRIQIVVSLSIEDFHNNFEPNQSLLNLFEKIQVLEPSIAQTINILEDNLVFIESQNQVFFTYDSLKAITELSDRYIKNKTFPVKAIDLANEVAIYTKSHGQNIVIKNHVENVVSAKTKIPTSQIQEKEREKLMNLENILRKRVIGQDQAIKVVSDALKRARTGLSATNRPIGSFLFLGPTGVGKTETTKALAEAYFGSEKEMIRLDMSEYQDANSINKLIGGTGAGAETGLLTKQVIDKPFSVILLDEVEKANPNILNLFLQILDDGRATDGFGRLIDFTNTIIIATSNAGAEFIRQKIMKKETDFKVQLLDFLQSRHVFKPEFLNRFDAIVAFKPLDMNLVVQITQMLIDKLVKNLYDKKQIKLVIDQKAVIKLAQIGFDPTLGARPLRRAVQDHVENRIAQKILEQDLKPGSEIMISESEII